MQVQNSPAKHPAARNASNVNTGSANRNVTITSKCTRCRGKNRQYTVETSMSMKGMRNLNEIMSWLVASGFRKEACPRCGSYCEAHISFC